MTKKYHYVEYLKKIEGLKGLDATYERRNFRSTLKRCDVYVAKVQTGEIEYDKGSYNHYIETLRYAVKIGLTTKDKLQSNIQEVK